MEKFCVKGYLKRSGKRVLSIFLCACMIGTMIPITARAETEGTSMPSNGEVTCTCANLCTEDKVNSDCPVCGAEEADLSKCTGKAQSENNENQLNTGESEEAKNETELTITAWEWIDEEECINPETGILALPFANEETPAFFDDVVALLPTQIQATVVNEEDIEAEAASETITLGDWSCEEYPKEGAYSGSYTFAAALPEGYGLSEEAKALTVLVELGGAQMYESVEGVIVGDFTVTGGALGDDYTYADGVLTIKSYTSITIANTDPNTPTTDRIEVAEGYWANITLAGVNIDVSVSEDTAAFKNNSVLGITLAEGSVNKLKSGRNCAGLQMMAERNRLRIGGEGELIATGGDNGAGIGGGDHGSCSGIIISGGTVIATGSGGGAGIGGGDHGKSYNISIYGGTVTATGSGGGAGIGGGSQNAGSRIEITGGTVTATGSGGGAGIGGGDYGSGSDITITRGTVTATGGSNGGAGIGGGYYSSGSDITITGGTVTATGGGNEHGGAGIGGDNFSLGSNISIEGGTVTATGSGGGAGIGGGDDTTGSYITMDGDAVLYTSSINGEHTFSKGVVYDGVTVSCDAGSYTLAGGVGTVYGNPNVSEFTKPAGSILGTYLEDTNCINVTVPDVDYTGAEAVPTATVTVDKIALGGTKTLVQGTDYTVSVSSEDKTNAGAKTATITAMTGSGNVGETTKAFNVNTVDLSADKIKMTLSEIPEAGYVYDNAAKEPVPVVTLKRADGSEYTLIKDTDYTVSYSNNTNAYELLSGNEGYEADKAPTVKITAKDGGNFSGSRSMNFNILLADMPEFTITPYSGS